jgi:hypothetical protein
MSKSCGCSTFALFQYHNLSVTLTTFASMADRDSMKPSEPEAKSDYQRTAQRATDAARSMKQGAAEMMGGGDVSDANQRAEDQNRNDDFKGTQPPKDVPANEGSAYETTEQRATDAARQMKQGAADRM